MKRRGREKEVIPIPDCPLHTPEINQAFAAVRALLPPDLPLAFVLATGPLITLILKTSKMEKWLCWARGLEPELRKSGIEGLQINWHPSAGKRVLSSRHQERVFGPEFVSDGAFFHGAFSFRQQIPGLEEEALRLAEDFLIEAEATQAVDLYSGAGSTLRRWTKHWNTTGIELVGEAHRAALINAPGATVLRGKVEHRLRQLPLPSGEKFVLYTNPPRSGHSPEALNWILHARPLRIAYLSCNQRTLANDLAALQNAFNIHRIQPFDFFPQTDHVEALALLRAR